MPRYFDDDFLRRLRNDISSARLARQAVVTVFGRASVFGKGAVGSTSPGSGINVSARIRTACARCVVGTRPKALAMTQAVDETTRVKRGSILDPYKPRIDAVVAQFPKLSAVRVCEEIRKGSNG